MGDFEQTPVQDTANQSADVAMEAGDTGSRSASGGRGNGDAIADMTSGNVPQGDIEARVASTVDTRASLTVYLNRGTNHGVKRGMWLSGELDTRAGKKPVLGRVHKAFATRSKAIIKKRGDWPEGELDKAVNLTQDKPALPGKEPPKKPDLVQAALISAKCVELNGLLDAAGDVDLGDALLSGANELRNLVFKVGKGLPLDEVLLAEVKTTTGRLDTEIVQPALKGRGGKTPQKTAMKIGSVLNAIALITSPLN